MALQASSKVKGITIEIGADTTSFGYAMKQIRQEASLVAKDMRTVDDAMKLDPNNIEKAADKLKLLREAADNTTKKVETIKKAIEQLNKEYADKSSEEYKKQLDYLTRSLESASREQEVANARLKDFQTNASGAKVEVMNLGQMIEAHLTANAVSTFMNIASKAISSVISKIKELSRELANFSKEAVLSAAEYQDAIGYSETVFGDYAENQREWIKENSDALRISEKTLTQYMNKLGQLLHSQGIEESEALGITENLMSLAADIRAATGMDTNDILAVMQRGFTTSVKNFKQFGVVMTEAGVKAYALANGMGTATENEKELAIATAELEKAQADAAVAMALHTEESDEFLKAEEALTAAEEKYNEAFEKANVTLSTADIIIARYLLLLESLENIVGQNEREHGLFNSQLALTTKKFEDLKDTIGLQLLPVATKLITKFNEFLQSDEGQVILKRIVEQFEKWAATIEEMMDDGRITTFLNDLIDELPRIAEYIGNLVTKLLELIPKVADIADQFIVAKNQSEGFRSKLSEILDLFKLDEWDLIKYIINPTGLLSGGTSLVSKATFGNLGKLLSSNAQGGPVSAGQLLRVNDDAGHRTEMFIPSVPGQILSGDKTDRIINNTNNSRTVGDVNIYLTATSSNASAIADQIGEEVQRRLRMSGAYLY